MCVCVCYSSASLFTGSLGAFIHRVCVRPSFFCCEVGDIEKRRDNRREKKKLQRIDWCNRRVHYIKKAKEKKKKRPRREKTKLSVNAREEKKREVRRDWLVHFDNWNEDDKEMLSPVRRERRRKKRRDGKKLYSHSTEKKERKKCVYTESGQQHVPPKKSHCIHFPVIRASSSLLVFTYIYNIDDKMKKRRCVQRVI